MIFRTNSAHEEAADVFYQGKDCRDFAVNTKKFSGDGDGNVKKLPLRRPCR